MATDKNSGGNQIHGDEFRSEEFSKDFIGRVAYGIFHWRKPLLIIGILITIFFGWSASHLKVTAGFTKMIPLHHEYMKTFLEYQDTFGGADRVLLMVKVKQGDILTKDVMATIKNITEEVFYVKGVERSSVTSIFTPNVRYTEVIEGGFTGGNITPATFAGTPEDLALVKKNILKSDWYGRIVSPDLSAVLVAATLQERDVDTGERFDLREVGSDLEKIRSKYESDQVSVSIIGFAKASADIADGASNVLIFFVAAFVITAILLLW